ncbi:MAG: hypothetical protein R3C56_38025 [Pirellulaceae bacterium]
MTAKEDSQAILRLVEEESGKPVIVESDSSFSGHATLKIAGPDGPAHVLRYKPEFESELPYLIAFQCGLALRTIRCRGENRFDLASTPRLATDVQRLVNDHLRQAGGTIPSQLIPQLCNQFASGLGLQLRSMPVAIRVDDWLLSSYPSLDQLQRTSIERQLQEAMQSLGPNVKAIAPKMIIDANASMSTAFAKFWAKTWGDPTVAVPFISAGYNAIGDELLSLVDSIDATPDGDRALVDAWAKRLELDGWFQTINKQ